MIEEFRDIKGYEGIYQVSNLGNVRSLDRYVGHPQKGERGRFCKGITLKLLSDKDGYHKVNLKKKQKGNNQIVHRLVANAFIENPQNKPQVNHINGLKNDNRLENLEWVTLSENRQHAYDTGLQNGENRRGKKSNFNKLTEVEVFKIKELLSNKVKQKQIALLFNVSQECISLIKTKRNWGWL